MKPHRAYKKHAYSGKKPSSKQSKAGFRRWHGDTDDTSLSRSKVWRVVEQKENEEPNLPARQNIEQILPGPSNVELNQPGPSSVKPNLPGPSNVKTYSRKRCRDTEDCIPSISKAKAQKQKPKTLNIQWPAREGVEEHILCVEGVSNQDAGVLSGYRVVDINHVINTTLDMQKKHMSICTLSNIELISEKRDGLTSLFIFKCTTCHKEFVKTSEANEKVNKAFVWGTLTSGSYYAQSNHLLCSMDVPTMSDKVFRKTEQFLGTIFEVHLLEEMQEAGKREREIAIEKGHIGQDGIPYIMVHVDGGWSKRSYGHNFNAASGTIATDTKMSLEARKILSGKIKKLTVVAQKQMKCNKNDAQKMRKDLRNGPYHVFGDHENCEEYYCRYVAEENKDCLKDENVVPTLKKHILVWARIETAIENICRKADRLIADITNNIAENFMSIMAKFNCGKRLNLSKRGSYTRRAHIAGLHQISGNKWQAKAFERATKHQPGPFHKLYLERNQKIAELRGSKTRKRNYNKLKGTAQNLHDKDYGPEAADVPVEIPENELKELCDKKLQELQVEDLETIQNIQESTIGQHGNALYDELRKDRLTASQFGMICKRRSGNPCHNHVKAVLYKTNFANRDTAYGQIYEKVAIRKFEMVTNKTVIPSGLFIDPEYGFLGASPDGIVVGESAIVEVKTFPSLARSGQNILEAARSKKNFCVYVDPDGDLRLRKNHNFYFQFQGQIHISRRERCYLILFVANDVPMEILPVEKDEEFVARMIQKLKTFYIDCVLPEVILRRIPGNNKCREPNTGAGNTGT